MPTENKTVDGKCLKDAYATMQVKLVNLFNRRSRK